MKANQDSGQRATLLAFGRLLKRLRMAADLTQEELAERAMVSARSISDLERGRRNPSVKAIGRIAQALGVSPDTLLRVREG